MSDYYSDRLSADRLKECYKIATPRVRQYLEAEIDYTLSYINPQDTVLELGCGYGRILPRLAHRAGTVIGIDTSLASLEMGRTVLEGISNCVLACMNAVRLAFRDDVFNLVVCIQNGISAFHVDQRELVRESVRVAMPGGKVIFSSYADTFWEERLEWFRLQSEAGLIGEIDYAKTGNGIIVCKDGFTATTVRPDRFMSVIEDMNVSARHEEVDGSSVFYEIVPR